jgi:parvulin-like peptidyl-prolyl cis-trans isomerase-like protein
MSIPFPDAPTLQAEQPARAGRARWLREPLLHFVALGAALFAADHFLVLRADDPRTIVITREVADEARNLFKGTRGRDPTPEEMQALRRVWLDNEVLYREGLALRVDRGDSAIRERVIFKALSVVDAGVKTPPIEERTLREWFQKNRAKYDLPVRYDFQEAVLSGAGGEEALRAFAEALNRGSPGDTQASLRVFKGRPHANLVESYGAEFVSALEQAPVGRWHVYRAANAWRAIRLEAITPGEPARFEALRGVVLQDWTDAVLSEQRTAAVRALAKKYTVRDEAVKR